MKQHALIAATLALASCVTPVTFTPSEDKGRGPATESTGRRDAERPPTTMEGQPMDARPGRPGDKPADAAAPPSSQGPTDAARAADLGANPRAPDALATDVHPADARPGDGAAPSDQPAAGDIVVVAVGDIAGTGGSQSKTAALVSTLMKAKPVAAILTLGDHAYDSNTASEFTKFYTASWGAPDLLAITRPAPGNHEYYTKDAKGYYDYFNGVGKAIGRAGDRSKGYYSYDLGAWHFVVVNSNDECGTVACNASSAQVSWIKADLAASHARCTVAYMHHPRFNDGKGHGDSAFMADVWNALYDGGADLVLGGHDHIFEQLGPMDKTGKVDRERGMRSFVVGTGGIDLYTDGFGTAHKAASEFKQDTKFGVLELTMGADMYSWRYVAVGGAALVSGSDRCH
jgi:hypothetical protein